MKAVIVAVSLLLAVPGAADIIEWRDSDGVRHFTNLKDEIPAENRDAAHVVVDEAVHHGPSDAVAPATVVPPEGARQAQVFYDRTAATQAYLEGIQRGIELGQAARTGNGGNVQINGPLAVSAVSAPPLVAPWSYRYPLVTTGFDGGRSRHLTLRMLLEDQFAIDRDGLFAVGGGVPFGPFLPCGFAPTVPCGRRVLRR